jgi:parallel beta-helix repeat protein
LAKDLESNSTCISIVSRDVLVDCAGNSITGIGPAGAANAIYAVSVSNAVAKNCVIRNYSAGAYFDSCEFCALENSTTTGSDRGAWFRNSPHSRAFMVNASENGIGIFFQHSNGFNATANLASGNADGFKFESASSGTIESNVAANNSGNGFYFFESSQNAIRKNLAYGNAEGFRLTSYSNDNGFSANNATQNAGNGFFFGPSVGNSFAGSRACGNGKNLACVYVQKDGGNNTCGALGAEVSCLNSVYCLGC